jgi:hypothetical protein
MSNDTIAKDEVRGNISSNFDLHEFDKFEDFESLIYKTNIMA